MKKILLPFFILLFSASLFAQLKISGDFRLRPRYDVRDADSYGNYQADFYYMYRARINMRFDIGDGWHFKTQLGHNGFGGYDFTSYLSQNPNIPVAVEGANRPSVHFQQLYYGKQSKEWGFIGGIIPISSLGNPLYDAHYYPKHMVDVPFILFSAGSAFGFDTYFKLGNGKLGIQLLADHNDYSVENKDGKDLIDLNDSYTVAANYTFKVAKFTVQPMIMFSWAPDNYIAPLTYGLNLTTPKFGKFTFGGSFLMSKQDDPWFYAGGVNPVNHGANPKNVSPTDPAYELYQFRVKVSAALSEKVSVLAWFDHAQRTDELFKGIAEHKHKFNYVWAMLNYTVYKSKRGKVVISPTIRINNQKVDNFMNFTRGKYEVSTTISF